MAENTTTLIKFLGEEGTQAFVKNVKDLCETKANVNHTHTEIDNKISELDTSISNITSGTTTVKESEHSSSADKATNADSATNSENAEKATKDSAGNIITDTYETKDDSNAKLEEAKLYTDTAIESIDFSKDYEQNDETHPEYIKNRPFYTGSDILNYVRGETFSTESGSWNTYPFLKEGMTYKVIWNGQEYLSTCETVNGNLQIGNATVNTETPDTTKEPYLFQDMAGMLTFMYFIKEESQTYTYEIYERTEDVKVLDRKYIPYVAGEKAEGKIFEYDGNKYKGGINAEIFNDYVGNKATGNYSHVEGCNNIANHWYTHAEGLGVRASGPVSHSEGAYTVSTGSASHAEGSYTIAASGNQHVQGTYNIEDAEGRYAHIVGNGDSVYDSATQSSNITRSNAHTVDWNGNGWYAGNLYVGGTSQDDAMPLTAVQIIKLEDGD